MHPDRSFEPLLTDRLRLRRSVPEDAAAISTLLAKGAMNGVIFRVDDVDTTFEKIRGSGAEVLQEPIDQPYGVRDFAFRDPSGNHIRFSSGPKD